MGEVFGNPFFQYITEEEKGEGREAKEKGEGNKGSREKRRSK